MFGETVSFAESLQVTVLGMGVVFVVLVLLMYIIKIMEKVMYRVEQKDAAPIKGAVPEQPAAAPKPAAAPEPASADTGSDVELVAVIAAAA
ncbi:MAG TPA: OadG family transporter subunit, partial [Bacillota bacterium]|nr:OadG family transporter subunit [Bacillota bacterium]